MVSTDLYQPGIENDRGKQIMTDCKSPVLIRAFTGSSFRNYLVIRIPYTNNSASDSRACITNRLGNKVVPVSVNNYTVTNN